MALFSFFNTSKNQRYEYHPRFWDPEKEQKKQRLEHLENIKNTDPDQVKSRLTGSFRRGYVSDAELRTREVNKSNRNLVIIILVLLALSYIFLTIYLPEIVASVEGPNAK